MHNRHGAAMGPAAEAARQAREGRPHNPAMIGRITGTLAEKAPPLILVDVGGVGYEIDVPMSSFYNLPGLGERVTLLTHFVVREDVQQLFGFLTHEERATFRELVKISGVGPRTALSILSGLSVADLSQAVSRQEAGRLVKVPGIGKKTAERLLLELKGKLGPDLGQPAASAASDAQADIVQALVALGYNERDANAALKALPPGVAVSEGIKLALKALSR
jgi:Holliday junction DNA helicase RuvA